MGQGQRRRLKLFKLRPRVVNPLRASLPKRTLNLLKERICTFTSTLPFCPRVYLICQYLRRTQHTTHLKGPIRAPKALLVSCLAGKRLHATNISNKHQTLWAAFSVLKSVTWLSRQSALWACTAATWICHCYQVPQLELVNIFVYIYTHTYWDCSWFSE